MSCSVKSVPCRALNLSIRVEAAATQVEQAWGPVALLVNNAASLYADALMDIALDKWNQLLSVNLTGYLLCAQSFGRRMVAQGEWRDYAVVGHRDFAEFAVFRRSGDAPAYRIEKRPALQNRQGQWAVIGEGGQILRRGRDLAQVLRVFDGRRFRVVD